MDTHPDEENLLAFTTLSGFILEPSASSSPPPTVRPQYDQSTTTVRLSLSACSASRRRIHGQLLEQPHLHPRRLQPSRLHTQQQHKRHSEAAGRRRLRGGTEMQFNNTPTNASSRAAGETVNAVFEMRHGTACVVLEGQSHLPPPSARACSCRRSTLHTRRMRMPCSCASLRLTSSLPALPSPSRRTGGGGYCALSCFISASLRSAACHA